MSGRYNTGDEDNLAKQVAELRKRVADLEAGNRIGATTIDRGSLVVASGASVNVLRPLDGGTVIRVGDTQDLGLWGIAVFNPNPDFPVSNPIFEAGTTDPDGFFPDGLVNVIDHQGDFVFALGYPFGLSRPYGAYTFFPTSGIGTPSLSTTSGTFAGLWTVYGYSMHPGISVAYIIQNDVGTTSEVRLRDAFNSNPTTTPTAWGSGAYSFGNAFYQHLSPAAAPSDPPFAGMLFQTDLEVRRTSGAGTVRIQILSALGSG